MDLLKTFEDRLHEGFWFRRGLSIVTIYLAFKMTDWGMAFANTALSTKADLMGTAGVIAAVAGIPIALVTIVYTKYVEQRTTDANGN